MKKVWFGLILVSLMAVSAFADTTSRKFPSYDMRAIPMILDTTMQRLFTATDCPSLALKTVGDFWNNDTISTHTGPVFMFSFYPGLLGGEGYHGLKKGIVVSVFDSQITAYREMERRRHNVAAPIVPGRNHDVFNGNWWYCDNSLDNAIFVNQGNTIIEVAHSEKPYEAVEGELVATAKEIVARMKAITGKKQ
jgi:hypothetical protein